MRWHLCCLLREGGSGAASPPSRLQKYCCKSWSGLEWLGEYLGTPNGIAGELSGPRGWGNERGGSASLPAGVDPERGLASPWGGGGGGSGGGGRVWRASAAIEVFSIMCFYWSRAGGNGSKNVLGAHMSAQKWRLPAGNKMLQPQNKLVFALSFAMNYPR